MLQGQFMNITWLDETKQVNYTFLNYLSGSLQVELDVHHIALRPYITPAVLI
jgi:hypothetical protein